MKAVLVLEPVPSEIEAIIQRRRAFGQDHRDEVWEGVYHMAPGPGGPHAYLLNRLMVLLDPGATRAGLVGAAGFNLGSGADDYRVPDGGYLREIPTGVWLSTAAVVVEVLSPCDETYDKFEFYAAHGVEEIVVVDPATRHVKIWLVQQHPAPHDKRYAEVGLSALLDITAEEIAAAITWPAT